MPTVMFEPSAESRFFRDRIRKMAVGDILTDKELSELIGKPFDEQAQSTFRRAKEVVQKADKIVVERVLKTGYKRLEDADIVKASEKHSARIRGGAKRGARELACADYDKLKPAEQLLATTKQTIFGLISSLASDDGLKRVAPGFSPGVLQVGDLISGMKK